MAATFGRALLAGLLLLNTGTAIASPITPDSSAAPSPDSSAVILKETSVPFTTAGTGAIQTCPGGCSGDETAAIPEPAALFLLGTGVVLLTTHRRRRRQRAPR